MSDAEEREAIANSITTFERSLLESKDEKQSLRQFIRDEFRKVHDRLNKIERDIG
jgi:hypothetical protein